MLTVYTEDYFRVIIDKTAVSEALSRLDQLTSEELLATVAHTNTVVREGILERPHLALR